MVVRSPLNRNSEWSVHQDNSEQTVQRFRLMTSFKCNVILSFVSKLKHLLAKLCYCLSRILCPPPLHTTSSSWSFSSNVKTISVTAAPSSIIQLLKASNHLTFILHLDRTVVCRPQWAADHISSHSCISKIIRTFLKRLGLSSLSNYDTSQKYFL